MAKADSTRSTHAPKGVTHPLTVEFGATDNRHELFDIRALGNSAYQALSEPTVDCESQADIQRLVRMMLDRCDDALEKINRAEESLFARKGEAA